LNVERFNEECNNVIFTHSDYFPNVFFSFLLKRRNPGAKWIIFYHMLAANPFKNIKNQFTSGGYCIPKINMLLNWINEKVCFFLIKSADLIVIHNGLYEKALRKHNRRILILENYGGIEKNEYLRTKKPTGLNRKRYDACFIGRFHEQKGVLEMIEIIKNIKKW